MESNQPRARLAQALSVPAQSSPPKDSFLLNPKEVKRWAEELPVANIGETARQVYRALVEFNRFKIPTLTRTEIIESFRKPVEFVCHNVSRHYRNAGFPLPPRGRKAAKLVQALYDEMANSYKILFLEQILGDERSFNQKLVIVAAQRALHYLNKKMLHCLLVYDDYPTGLWREANHLFAWAYHNQVQDIPVKETQGLMNSRKNARSIASIYKGMLILASTHPHRLRQPQIRRVHHHTLFWEELASLRPASEAIGDSGLFFVNLWSDEPCKPIIEERQRLDSRYMVLDLNAIIGKARTEYETAEWESPARLDHGDDHLSRTLLRLLILNWTKSLKRKLPRIDKRGKVETIVGLGALIRFLEKQEEEEKENELQLVDGGEPSLSGASRLTWNDSVFSTLAIAAPPSTTGGDSLLGDPNAAISTLLGATDLETQAAGRPGMESPPAVLTYNESAEGYCLAWRKNYPVRVRVGDILGVRHENHPDDVGVTVVRWLKQRDDNETAIGLQVMAQACSLVYVAEEGKAGIGKHNRHRYLLLSNNDPDDPRQTLLTNTRVFPEGTRATLFTEFGKHRIELTKWLESNNNFVHYQFKYVDQPPEKEKQNETVGTDNQFEDLWNDL